MSWRGRRVLVTAGPTREHLDPIRFMSNGSTGAMGFALAAGAARRGAEVTVVAGPVAAPKPRRGVRVVPVVSALEMRREVLKRCAKADVLIAAAAVGDWRFKTVLSSKLKRDKKPLRLTLIPNPDIIQDAARRLGRFGRATAGRRKAVLVGFALETADLLANAVGKLRRKRLDLIVANGPESMGGGRARVTILQADGSVERLPAMTKPRAAAAVLDRIERHL